MSISKAIGALLRRRVESEPLGGPGEDGGVGEDSYFDPVLGLRVSRCDGELGEGEVRAALDGEDEGVAEQFRESGCPLG
ncbi:MAG TPA: hypothetical protein VMN36_05505 [Verrucomicrobiales bacterium]|nr:hypothetical protein [Verrucomicrobiales bacterium]